ncbi:MAG: hypothetical protein U5P10_08430 [Spirochaetia bacterium]|nr:hypothetical protein [Spirochaetia bacterium]
MLGRVFTLVLTGFPIAFVIGSVAFIVGFLVFGPDTTYHILYSRFYGLSLNYPYLAVPLFTFMGWFCSILVLPKICIRTCTKH